MEKQFIERSGHGFLDEEESSSSKKRKEAERAAQSSERRSSKPKKKESPKVRVFEGKGDAKPPPSNEDSDIKRSDGKKSGKKSTPDKESSSERFLGKVKAGGKESSTIKRLVEKTQSKKEEYLTFYKYYYERLGAEHPRWTKNQIATIIKLLWRKRNKTSRRDTSRIRKGLSGYQLFRRTKEGDGFIRDQIKAMWRALPIESKRYWKFKAQGRPVRHIKNVKRVLDKGVMRSEDSETKPQVGINWMSNFIQ